jgi:putative ABC transport system substrate-binding protein
MSRHRRKRWALKCYLAGAINPKELDNAFSQIVREKAGAVVIQGDPFFNQQRYRIAELAAQYRLPLIGPNSEYAEAGILMSYGVNRAANFRRAATFVDKVFKGADPGNLPVEQPTKFELVINKKNCEYPRAHHSAIASDQRRQGNRVNNRRKLVFALGAGAVGVPFTSFSQQQGKVWRVGFLAQRHLDFVDSDFSYGPFRQGMRELGYVEGKNLVMEWRSAEGKSELLPGLAAELVRLNVDALAASGTPATVAAQKATTTIPIIMIAVADPVANGLVKSLARPGGNTTGNSGVFADLGPTLLEILFDMVPKLSSVAILKNPSNPGQDTMLKNIQPAAQKFGVKILPVEARTPQDIEQAFSTMAREKSGAVIVLQNPLFQQQKSQIVKLAAEHRLPTTTMYREYVEAGRFDELWRKPQKHLPARGKLR